MIAALLALVPSLINGVVTAYNKTKDVTITTIKTTGTVAAAQLGYMTAALDHPFSPVSIVCYAVAFWFFKAVAIDKVICPVIGMSCSTDALGGQLWSIAQIAMGGMFALYGIVRFRQ